MSWKQLGIALAFMGASSPALAADLGFRPAQCAGEFRSPILALPSPQAIEAEVGRRYHEALIASEDPRVINSHNGVYVWALETKVSCAKAIGYLKYHEVNPYQIGQCDCFYGRMRMLPH